MRHGEETRANPQIPHSIAHEGFHGRLFRHLPPFEPPLPTAEGRRQWLRERARAMVGDAGESGFGQTYDSPAGYTYFGQFLTHDLSFDTRSLRDRHLDPDRRSNARTPRLDLDSVYGAGPSAQPYLYVADAPRERPCAFRIDGSGGSRHLPRLGGAPVAADPRNARHVITEQIHVAVMGFHNRALRQLLATSGLRGEAAFDRACQLTRWHYQWVVVHDFLPRIADRRHIEPHRHGLRPDSLFHWRSSPFVPLEFSAAAFRFGHSMVRARYTLSAGSEAVPTEQLLRADASEPAPTVVWEHLLRIGSGENTQYARALGPTLTPALDRLPPAAVPEDGIDSLAFRDLLRGWQLGLPSGQAVARAIGARVIDSAEDPLWIYVLDEARREGYGNRLGPVGSRIVADVILGLLWGDPGSYLRMDPRWRPSLGRTGRRYELADFLRFAGMPMTDAQLATDGADEPEGGAPPVPLPAAGPKPRTADEPGRKPTRRRRKRSD